MTVDGREDLYNYTYLSANGYLNKFRGALNMPSLSLPLLAALLKTFNDRKKLVRFIVKNSQGKECLYYKRTLNQILGMSDDGHMHTKPENNPNIQFLHRIIDEWDAKAYEKEKNAEKGYEPIDYSSDEEDMQKMSDALANLEESKKVVKNDKGEIVPERCDKCGGKVSVQIHGEPVYLCKDCGKYFGTMPCGLNENCGKNIFITEEQFNEISKLSIGKKKIYISESQEKELMRLIFERYFVEPDKVKIVKNFLDSNFERGGNPVLGDDGYPSVKPILGLKIPGSGEQKPMTPSQVFYMLQDKFKDMYSDRKQRDSFLKQVLIDWYNKNISFDGILSKNYV